MIILYNYDDQAYPTKLHANSRLYKSKITSIWIIIPELKVVYLLCVKDYIIYDVIKLYIPTDYVYIDDINIIDHVIIEKFGHIFTLSFSIQQINLLKIMPHEFITDININENFINFLLAQIFNGTLTIYTKWNLNFTVDRSIAPEKLIKSKLVKFVNNVKIFSKIINDVEKYEKNLQNFLNFKTTFLDLSTKKNHEQLLKFLSNIKNLEFENYDGVDLLSKITPIINSFTNLNHNMEINLDIGLIFKYDYIMDNCWFELCNIKMDNQHLENICKIIEHNNYTEKFIDILEYNLVRMKK